MKRTQNKAFTLVELIVVITILAILGTIAFISLQGYSWDAKNSKVTSDLKSIQTALEAKRTQDSTVTLRDFVTWDLSTDNGITWAVGSGATLATTNYSIGNMDFVKLEQNGSEFKDGNSAWTPDYIYAATAVPGFSAFQLAGQIIEDDVKKARVIGNYYEVVTTDVDWLITASSDTAALENDATIGWTTPELY